MLAGLDHAHSQLAWTVRPDRGILPRIIFWVVGLLTSPLLLVGLMALLFGSDLGDRVFGVVMLTLFLPAPIALYRRARPRS